MTEDFCCFIVASSCQEVGAKEQGLSEKETGVINQVWLAESFIIISGDTAYLCSYQI